jgi:iron only hydrogenase large subunit-like protein
MTFAEMRAAIAAAREDGDVHPALVDLGYDPHHLECVLSPVTRGECPNCEGLPGHCPGKAFVDCLFDNIRDNEAGVPEFVPLTTRCRERIDPDRLKPVLAAKDLMAALRLVRGEVPVFVLVAPAFNSQFGEIDDARLRTAFKRLGFAGMVEVSLFADILTLKEALEFDRKIVAEADYMLTSCCCPVWIQMIRRLHPFLLDRVPGSVSPMVAAGRVVKRMVPGARTVFVGPCLAKKAEAREKDIADAIDEVLTFHEAADLFAAARIDPRDLPEDRREHSSFAGRVYAVAGGVSESVAVTLDRIRPKKPIRVRAVQADGVPECKRLLEDLESGRTKANFLEGMGCAGGCVGGPRALIDRNAAMDKVRTYAKDSPYATPIDNPYVVELLHRLGIVTIEQLLEDDAVFTRHL